MMHTPNSAILIALFFCLVAIGCSPTPMSVKKTALPPTGAETAKAVSDAAREATKSGTTGVIVSSSDKPPEPEKAIREKSAKRRKLVLTVEPQTFRVDVLQHDDDAGVELKDFDRATLIQWMSERPISSVHFQGLLTPEQELAIERDTKKKWTQITPPMPPIPTIKKPTTQPTKP